MRPLFPIILCCACLSSGCTPLLLTGLLIGNIAQSEKRGATPATAYVPAQNNNADGLRAAAEALKAAGQPQQMMSPEEIRERQTTRKSMLNDNYLFCQSIDKNTFSCRDNR
jgi:hypothetical protein